MLVKGATHHKAQYWHSLTGYNRPTSQIPQCIKQISHNVPFFLHISVTKWDIVGYGTGAMWDLWDVYTLRLCHWGGWCIYAPVNRVIIGSGNGLLPDQHQAITWTNDDLMSTRPSGTNFSAILIKTQQFSLRKLIRKYCLQNISHFVSASMC